MALNWLRPAAGSRRGSDEMEHHDPGVFLGREAEIARLRAAIERREGLAIWGPADAGKTALVRHTLAKAPREVARKSICLPLGGPPHSVLSALLGELHVRGDGFVAGKFRSEARRGDEFLRWASRQTSLRMRGLLYRAAEAGHYWIFLDGVEGLSDAFARIVKELASTRRTPVYLIARGCSERELGLAARLYWNDDLRLGLAALPPQHARVLLEQCIRRFGLSRFNLEGFRRGILRLSGRLPGAIVKMCARAADAQYHFGGRVETRLLHVDYMMQFSYRARKASLPQAAIPAASIPPACVSGEGARK
jgi:AAA ATPase domain